MKGSMLNTDVVDKGLIKIGVTVNFWTASEYASWQQAINGSDRLFLKTIE